MKRNTHRRPLALASAVLVALALGLPAARAAYLFKCPKQTVVVVDYDTTGATTSYPSIQAAVDAANGTDAGSSVGDTVVICPGTYNENVTVPLADGAGSNTNLTIRSWKGADDTTVVGSASGPVFDITANGVTLGGPGLGITITGASPIGIQVGKAFEPDPDEDDDQELLECEPLAEPGKCADEEKPAATPINVSLIGNRVRGLTGTGSAEVTGISVTNSNNTLTYRNLVERLTAGAGGRVYGIRYSDTNSNVKILGNAVKSIKQTGGPCTGGLGAPVVAAIGVAVQEEALDGTVYHNLIEGVTSSCIAIGIYSDAWGGLENDRNGQQIPIVTDIVDNRIKKLVGATGTCTTTLSECTSANVVLAPNPIEDDDGDTNPPSSFRVLANDLDNAQVAVAVLSQMAPYSYIRENDFDDHRIGVLYSGNTNLDATNNWWGCAEGPESGKSSCATIVGLVYYQPPLKQHVDHAGAHAGEHAGHG